MAIAAIIREQFVAARDVNADDLKCPNCGSRTYVLVGNSQVERKEDWQNGTLLHTDLGKTHLFELEQIECLSCMTRCRIKPNELIDLQMINHQLRKQLTELTGKDPFGAGRPN